MEKLDEERNANAVTSEISAQKVEDRMISSRFTLSNEIEDVNESLLFNKLADKTE